MISMTFSIVLGAALLWTTAFSMTNRLPVRGLRNLGILACYLIGICMFVVEGVQSALATWILFGLIGGGLYFIHDGVVWLKSRREEKKPPISLSHFIYGQVAWPIMGPESVEYILAELGVLKPSAAQTCADDAENPQPGGGEERR